MELFDELKFETSDGSKQIQLWFGDITMLPTTEKADLLMISAFYGRSYKTISSPVWFQIAT